MSVIASQIKPRSFLLDRSKIAPLHSLTIFAPLSRNKTLLSSRNEAKEKRRDWMLLQWPGTGSDGMPLSFASEANYR